MSLLQKFIKNNCKINEEWKIRQEELNTFALNCLKNAVFIDLNLDLEVFKYNRKDCLKYERMQQVIRDVDLIILPYLLHYNEGKIYKVKNYENIYIFDDLYSRVLFEFKNKKLTTYEITTGLFYNPIID